MLYRSLKKTPKFSKIIALHQILVYKAKSRSLTDLMATFHHLANQHNQPKKWCQRNDSHHIKNFYSFLSITSVTILKKLH